MSPPRDFKLKTRDRITERVVDATTIFDIWRTYRDEVIPRDAPLVQVEETRRAFYAGAAAMFELVMRVSKTDVSEDEGCKMMDALYEELGAVTRDLRG